MYIYLMMTAFISFIILSNYICLKTIYNIHVLNYNINFVIFHT